MPTKLGLFVLRYQPGVGVVYIGMVDENLDLPSIVAAFIHEDSSSQEQVDA